MNSNNQQFSDIGFASPTTKKQPEIEKPAIQKPAIK
jgi:hypothetical protein